MTLEATAHAEPDPAPDTTAAARDVRRRWLAVFAFWTMLGLVESSKAYVSAYLRDIPASWPNALLGNMPWWYGWALLTPLAFALASRYRLDRHPVSAAAVHLADSIALAPLHLLSVGWLYYHTHAHANVPSLAVMLRGWMDNFIMLDVLTYWAIIGGYHALEYHSRFRASELNAARLATRAARLEASMTEARLNALRMELHPHFLFNTLNAISGLVRRREIDAAVRMLARLGELLRVTLERGSVQQVPLERELSFLRLYLEIERIRFHDRLGVDFEVDPEVLDALVPTLILQPLVENAVRHGVARLSGPGRVGVRAARQDGKLILQVADTGAGFQAGNGGTRLGVGLSNTRARLEQLYGADAAMMLDNGPAGGALVTVTLPYHEDPVADREE
jgi:sensor histidine kinase YesM